MIHDGFCAFDELWLVLDSRTSLTKKNRFVANVLSKSRKRQLNISYTVQVLDSLDKRVRKVQDFTAIPILNPNENLCKVNIFRTGYPKFQGWMKCFYFKTPLIFNMYDTNYEIMMEEEVDEDPPIIFQETKDSKPQYLETWEEADKIGADFWEEKQENLKKIF